MTAPERHAVVAGVVFDGTASHRAHAVVIDGPRIAGIIPARDVPPGMAVHRIPEGAWLAPGFIDVQVNGGGDVLFNDDPTPLGIAALVAAHRKFGTTALLPTLISDTADKMHAALAAVQAAVDLDPSVLGIHFEGPFLSPDQPGAHDPRMIRRPESRNVEMLTSPRSGVVLMTLAPEEVPAGFIAQLARAGVRVSLGHSMATYRETRLAVAEGLTGFTHLFNAMRPLASREPGPIAAALESTNVWFGMIVDGAHVDPAMLRLALRGAAHPMLVTDAMPPVGGTRSEFRLNGHAIAARNGCCVRHDGRLAGTCLDMAAAIRNCVELLQVPLTAALRAASAAPAAFLGVAHRLGYLAPGHRADMVAFDPTDIRVYETWVAGQPSASAVGR